MDLIADHGFYRFPGSLTVPICNEPVQWYLMKNPVEMPEPKSTDTGSTIRTQPGRCGPGATVRCSRASEPWHPDLLKTASMRLPQWPNLSLVLLLSLCLMPAVVFQANAVQENAARAKPDASDQEKRQASERR
jgi:hypothetical protein